MGRILSSWYDGLGWVGGVKKLGENTCRMCGGGHTDTAWIVNTCE